LFRTSKDSDGHVRMYCNFDWEKEDGQGDYDREFGAPDAVKMFLFQVRMNNDDVERDLILINLILRLVSSLRMVFILIISKL